MTEQSHQNDRSQFRLLEDASMLDEAYAAIARELEAGELVGIFPEGKLTSDGDMDHFRGGITRKLRRLRHLFPRVRLSAGAPLAPAAATPERLRSEVLELRGAWR